MKRIIFFDGVCGLCNRVIDFVLSADKEHLFLYCPLQSETATKYLKASDLSLDTVIVLIDQNTFKKSQAVIQILHTLGGVYKGLSYLFRICPGFIADIFYDIVADNRYNWFGKKETCRLPTAEERQYFL